MKEYVVVEIRCDKSKKAIDIYNTVSENLKFNRNFFEFVNLFKKTDHVNKNKQKKFESLGLQKFSHIKVLEHLARSAYYDPKRDDRKLISNLDSSWEWYNKKETESLDNSLFKEVLDFGDVLNSVFDVFCMMFGIDEIEWDGSKVGHGTYGYEKAKSSSHSGENYLSNSITISKSPWEHKPYLVYLSCEARFRDLDIVNTVAESIGKIKNERHYFAPESEAEREEWKHAQKEAEIRFNTVIAELKEFIKTLPNELKNDTGIVEYDNKINVRKNIKKYLCTDGWEMRKNIYGVGTIVCKEKGDDTIIIAIDSLHGGHYLQLLIDYNNKKYSFGCNLAYSYTLKLEEEVCAYLENVRCIRDFVYDRL